MTATLLYGLRVASELPLHQDRPVPAGGVADVDIRLGSPMQVTMERPAGRLLVDLETEQLYYSAAQADDGSYLVRFYRTCDFHVDAELRAVTVHPVEGAERDLVGVLAAGTLLSFILAMRGHAVLHASAVQVGDAALAFVGSSGMGKSTMATLMCADGASLITDDVLRLDLGSSGPPICHLGATELRLRKAAGDLAARFDDTPVHRLTADARDALAMLASVRHDLPLAAIVIPLPDHQGERDKAEFTRLAPMEALLTLLRFPRVLGWQDSDVLGRQFQHLGEVVERVPVYTAWLPWGPPFLDDIAAQVREAVGLGSIHRPSPK